VPTTTITTITIEFPTNTTHGPSEPEAAQASADPRATPPSWVHPLPALVRGQLPPGRQVQLRPLGRLRLQRRQNVRCGLRGDWRGSLHAWHGAGRASDSVP
jgi:hypothetical protein